MTPQYGQRIVVSPSAGLLETSQFASHTTFNVVELIPDRTGYGNHGKWHFINHNQAVTNNFQATTFSAGKMMRSRK